MNDTAATARDADEQRIYETTAETVAGLWLAIEKVAGPVGHDLFTRMEGAIREFRLEHKIDHNDAIRAYNILRHKVTPAVAE